MVWCKTVVSVVSQLLSRRMQVEVGRLSSETGRITYRILDEK